MSDSEEEYSEGPYARAGAYRHGFTTGKPRAGFYAEAGVGRERVRRGAWTTQAIGPYADVRAEARPYVLETTATAGLGSISASTDPFADIDVRDAIGLGLGLDNIDRPFRVYEDLPCVRAGTYLNAFEDKPGRRLPKAEAYVEGSTFRVGAECSMLAVEAKGPNASARYEIGPERVGAKTTTELGSFTTSVGPVECTIRPNVDTGFSVGDDGLELSVLGSGITLGRNPSVSTPLGRIHLSF
ncbi:uncharacterized protein [Dendropsophus ebraccatus]|uniref:uncharacterized protein n=1 Tax=Dendropsophus ebraccatus TaxID=150705 RepID=UPI0038310021